MNIIALRVLDEFHQEGFYTARKTAGGTYYIDRTKITPEQYEKLKAIYGRLNHIGRTDEEQNERDEVVKKRKEQEIKKKLEQLQIIRETMK